MASCRVRPNEGCHQTAVGPSRRCHGQFAAGQSSRRVGTGLRRGTQANRAEPHLQYRIACIVTAPLRRRGRARALRPAGRLCSSATCRAGLKQSWMERLAQDFSRLSTCQSRLGSSMQSGPYTVGPSYWEDVVMDDEGGPRGEIVFSEEGVFVTEAGEYRALWIGSTLQSIVWLGGPQRAPHLKQPVLDYVQCMAVAGVAACSFSPSSNFGQDGKQQVAVLGVGGGALPAFVATYFPHLAIDAVELDACVVAAATRFMGLHVNQAAPCSLTTAVPQNAPTAGCEISSTSGVSPPRRGVNIHIGDAAQWLRAHHQRQEGDVRGCVTTATVTTVTGSSSASFSAIFLDCYDGDGVIPRDFRAIEFAELCLSVLRPGGALVVNLYDGYEDDLDAVRDLAGAPSRPFVDVVCQVFPSVHLLRLDHQPQNTVLLAVKDGSGRRPTGKDLYGAARKVAAPVACDLLLSARLLC